MIKKKTPKAVTAYMAEFGETETEVRDYILRQLEFFKGLNPVASARSTDAQWRGFRNSCSTNNTTTKEQWLGFKMGCSTTAAAKAIEWAQQPVGE